MFFVFCFLCLQSTFREDALLKKELDRGDCVRVWLLSWLALVFDATFVRCLVLSCPTLSCLALSCLALSYLFLSRLVVLSRLGLICHG